MRIYAALLAALLALSACTADPDAPPPEMLGVEESATVDTD